uniref:Bm13320 n=1 Tax=Brugia malayi TaxID=6279 RepID=A0A1I9G5P1_BRUMA|nr:Bm13320 [Brugia malayi]
MMLIFLPLLKDIQRFSYFKSKHTRVRIRKCLSEILNLRNSLNCILQA